MVPFFFPSPTIENAMSYMSANLTRDCMVNGVLWSFRNHFMASECSLLCDLKLSSFFRVVVARFRLSNEVRSWQSHLRTISCVNASNLHVGSCLFAARKVCSWCRRWFRLTREEEIPRRVDKLGRVRDVCIATKNNRGLVNDNFSARHVESK